MLTPGLVAWADESEPHPTRPFWQAIHCDPPEWCCRTGCLVRGFDGHLFLGDPRGCNRFELGGYLQLRYDRSARREGTTTRFDLDRYRVILTGQITPRWSYHFRAGANSTGESGVSLAQVTWHASPRLGLTLGEQFIAFSREDWMFAEDLLTTDYSANDAAFGTGVSEALQAIYQGSCDRIYAAVSSGDVGPESEFSGALADGSVALTSRYERQLFTRDWSTWDDLIGRRGRASGVLLGAGFGYRSRGGPIDSGALFGTLDVSAAWRGGQALAYVSARRAAVEDSDEVTSYGGLVQAGHFVTSALQAYGRYELVVPSSRLDGVETYHSLTVGCAFVPFRWTNRMKVSLEFARLFTGITQTLVAPSPLLGFRPSDAPQQYLRLQIQLGF